MKRRGRSGFSLVEVVLAIGVFAVGILALVGVMGPLMVESPDDAAQADYGQLVALTRSWLQEQGADQVTFESARTALLGLGDDDEWPLYAYAWEDPETSQITWQVGARSRLEGDFADMASGFGLFRSPIYRLGMRPAEATVRPEAFSDQNNFSSGLIPLEVVVTAASSRGPGSTIDEWETAVARSPRLHTFWSTLLAR